MKKNTLLLFVLIISICYGCSKKEKKAKSPRSSQEVKAKKKTVIPTRRDMTSQSKNIVKLLLEKKYDDIYKNFDDSIKGMLSPAKLARGWEGLEKSIGEFKKIKGTSKEDRGKFRKYTVHAVFAKTELDFKIAWNMDEKITGFFMSPVSGKTISFKDASYVKGAAFKEKSLKINPGTKWELGGYLTATGVKNVPVVILVHGSGPHDADETIGPNKVFRDLSYGLSSVGVDVLRYVKRTKAHPGECSKIKDINLMHETVDDAVSAFQLIKKMPEYRNSKVFIAGHSLGAFSIPLIASKMDADGYILLAGNSRPLEDLIIQQIKYISGFKKSLSPEEKKNIEKIEQQVSLVKSPKLNSRTPSEDLPLGISATYWIFLNKYKPVELMKKVLKPVLILQGKRDYQVTYQEDFKLWKKELKGMKNIKFMAFDKLNHLFMPGEGKPSPEEYMKPSHVSPLVIGVVAKFVKN
ncbi:MAG: DUF3887 domain-containing protein [Deltaproteobacteria bacterium]|nr:DUF3887 domain-containing protein [Deltaproteobacteria bacterium]